MKVQLLLKQLEEGQDILATIFRRQGMGQELAPALQRSNILKRLDDAYRDLQVNGYTEQSRGLRRITIKSVKRRTFHY